MLTPITQVWRGGRASYRPAGDPFDPRAFEVAAILGDTAARAFVVEHHYSRSYPAARRRFGLYQRGALVGVAVFSQPMHQAVLHPFDPSAAMELGRLVLLDSVASNAESWFTARAIDCLRREGVEGVVSYSDPMPRVTDGGRTVSPGHIGGIYQSLSAVYVGRGRSQYLRLLPDATVYSARSVSKIRNGERGRRYAVAQLVEAGATEPTGDVSAWLASELDRLTRRVRHPGNLRYLFPLSGAARREVKRVHGAGLPFVKLCDVGLCGDGRARFHRDGCDRRVA